MPDLAEDVVRADALERYGVVARPLGPDFDDAVAATAALCATPIAAINVIDARRQFTLAAVGSDTGPNIPRSQSWCTRVITSGRELHVPDVTAEPELAASLSHTESRLSFYLGTPLVTPEGVTVGSLCVADTRSRRLRADQVRGFVAQGRVVSALLEARRNLLALAEESARFEEAAATDPLTNLPNRRGISPLLAAVPPGTSVVKFDLDRSGQAAGDDVLRDFAAVLRTACRRSDHSARWGGEEFLLLLPETGSPRAAVVVDHLRERWARPGRVTFSAGIACTRPWEPVDRVLDRADTALHAARQAGRDRTVSSV